MWLDPSATSASRSRLFKAFWAALFLTSFFYSSSALAAVTGTLPDLQAMLMNFATAVPNLIRLAMAISYVMGMFFCIAAVTNMKHFGEMRTMMAREHGMWGPIMELLIGAALLYLPSSINAVMSSFWTTTNPYAYVTAETGTNAAFASACYNVVQLIGVVAFIRGLLILQQAAGERSSPGQLSKAMSHLVGGVLCINIYNTIQALEGTVGMLL